MKELIAPESVEKLLLLVAVTGPLAGLIVGIILGAHERRAAPRVIGGVLIGGIGTLAYAMWLAYNAITNRLGLDSLANLGLQIAIFAALGASLGVAAHRITLALAKLGAGRGH